MRHCLAPDVSRRYQTAQQLHEDLQRHVQDLPLKHAPEPSWRERGAKWVRRHPHLTAPTNLIMACFITLAVLIAPGAWRAWHDWQEAARQRLAKAQTDVHQAKKELQSADDRAREVQTKLQNAEAFCFIASSMRRR